MLNAKKNQSNSTKIKNHSSDDHSNSTSASSVYNMHTGHMSPTHHLHHHQHHQHSNAAINYQSHAQLLQQSHLTASGSAMTSIAPMTTTTTTATVNPMPNATNYPEEFYAAHDFSELGQSEHYIYVTYPPELKRRLLERYGREIYLTLLKKDLYD